MKKLLLLLCFVFIHQVVYPVYFKHLGMSDGLSQVSVMSIYQDCLGRMWFGTREGVGTMTGNGCGCIKAGRIWIRKAL